MKYISAILILLIIQGCTYLPELDKPYFDHPGAKGRIYSYSGTREEILLSAKDVLHSEFGVAPIKHHNYIETEYVPYSSNGNSYNKACRIKLAEGDGASELRINCNIVKYEYGFQANSIHNLFTKTWWGKDATDLENYIYRTLKSNDKPTPINSSSRPTSAALALCCIAQNQAPLRRSA